MKKLVLLIVCVALFAMQGFAQNSKFKGERGVTSIGALGGYAIDYKSIMVGIDYRYNILDRVRIAPSVMHVFENDSRKAWYLNMDFHYLARITNQFSMYPLGGVGVSIHKYEYKNIFGNDDETETRVGLNMGFGCEYRLSDDIIIGGEFRYNLTPERKTDQNMLVGRVAYYF